MNGELGEGCRVIGAEPSAEPDARLLRVSRSKGTAVLASDQEIRAGHGFAYVLADGAEGGFLITHSRRDGEGRWQCAVRIAGRGPHLPENLALRRNIDQQHDAEDRRAIARFAVPLAQPPAVSLDIAVVARLGQVIELRAEERATIALGNRKRLFAIPRWHRNKESFMPHPRCLDNARDAFSIALVFLVGLLWFPTTAQAQKTGEARAARLPLGGRDRKTAGRDRRER